MAWLIADELVQIRGGRGFETAESLAARGETRRPRRTGPARPAHQPHLRGLHRDHAPADRPRGRRRPPLGRRRPHRPGEVPRATRRRRAPTQASSTPSGCPNWSRDRANCPYSYGEFKREIDLSAHLRYVERTARKLARSTFYAMSRWQGRMETKQGFLGRIVDIGAELFAMSAACVRAELLRTTERPRPRGLPARRRLLPPVPHPRRGTLRPPVDQHRRPRPQGRQGRPVGHLHLAGGRHRRPLRRRPVDRRRDARPPKEPPPNRGEHSMQRPDRDALTPTALTATIGDQRQSSPSGPGPEAPRAATPAEPPHPAPTPAHPVLDRHTARREHAADSRRAARRADTGSQPHPRRPAPRLRPRRGRRPARTW